MEERIREALREVMDPEIGINIVDLGLVYDVAVRGDVVHIQLTMTTQACPLHEYITESARTAVRRALPELSDVDVEMVWDPPWSPAMMSAEAKRQMGWAS
ncbi:MAG: metal-sulfur cluster assembly factor [Candidatus Binatia bacterium]